jgi:hypothetical protein
MIFLVLLIIKEIYNKDTIQVKHITQMINNGTNTMIK